MSIEKLNSNDFSEVSGGAWTNKFGEATSFKGDRDSVRNFAKNKGFIVEQDSFADESEKSTATVVSEDGDSIYKLGKKFEDGLVRWWVKDDEA